MQTSLTDLQQRLLRLIFDHGARGASLALSKWLREEVHLTISQVEMVELSEATNLLGSPETAVAACIMGLTGRLTGLILLIFEDQAGFALVDLLMQKAVGATTEWGELEQSAAKETINIVGCAYINALATLLPGTTPSASQQAATNSEAGAELIPTPPMFVRDFAGSLLEFALMDQAVELDQVLLIHSQFTRGSQALEANWTLLFIPSRNSLDAIAVALAQVELPEASQNKRRT